ncbi:MAG: hypothetical protein AB7P44_02735 [Steroidobacteraceae bacterium]
MSDLEDTSHEAISATAPCWKRSQSLDLVHQLNEHCLELLADVTTADAGSDSPLVSANRDLWAQLGPEARKRAALLPFVILDLNFADETWWRQAIDAPASTLHEPDSTNWLPSDLCERLVQETLMFAWQMARSDRTAAQVSFGMRPTVAVIIGELMPGQVRAIASRASGDIHVRWEQDGRFWREILLAAEAGNDEAIAELHLHAKLQLLGPLVYPHQ